MRKSQKRNKKPVNLLTKSPFHEAFYALESAARQSGKDLGYIFSAFTGVDSNAKTPGGGGAGGSGGVWPASTLQGERQIPGATTSLFDGVRQRYIDQQIGVAAAQQESRVSLQSEGSASWLPSTKTVRVKNEKSLYLEVGRLPHKIVVSPPGVNVVLSNNKRFFLPHGEHSPQDWPSRYPQLFN
jgi:hypothetical protein